MEAKLDGTAVTVKVTQKWQELPDSKRQTIGQLVVDTWLKTAQTLQVLQTSERKPLPAGALSSCTPPVFAS